MMVAFYSTNPDAQLQHLLRNARQMPTMANIEKLVLAANRVGEEVYLFLNLGPCEKSAVRRARSLARMIEQQEVPIGYIVFQTSVPSRAKLLAQIS